jgi:energy-coupling factor transporter ATP-binding protein EcfA2
VARTIRPTLAAPPPDPFRERQRAALHQRLQLLGGQFHFETDSPRLLRLVQRAYAGLPSQRLPGAAARFRVRLLLGSTQPPRRSHEPPRIRPVAGAGMLCGAMDGATFAAITEPLRSALLVVSPEMLRFPYHIRYELLEFVVYVLASRVQKLLPLHAACVGRDGQGLLLLGPSGSGKSTVALHCLLQGLEFLAEDSVLLRPEGLLATGVANFLHVRADSLRFLSNSGSAALIRKSGVIRRRSGVEKFEIDLRQPQYRLAPAPLRIRAVVFASRQSAGKGPLLVPLRSAVLSARLAASQRYAAQQPGWSSFRRQVAALPGFELRRGRHPLEAAQALNDMLPACSGATSDRDRG